MNDEPVDANEAKKFWSDLINTPAADAPGNVAQPLTPSPELVLAAAAGIVPCSLRPFLGNGIAHDYMREDVHHKLAKDEFERGIAIGREQERGTHRLDLLFFTVLGIMAGTLIAAMLTVALR